jgi:hypothetical protein
MAQFELTLAQWETVMDRSPCVGPRSNPFYDLPGMVARINRPDHPVTISWNEAQEFIRRLNQKEGQQGCRLPTEAEWEYAARVGTTTVYSCGDDSSQLGRYAWLRGWRRSATSSTAADVPRRVRMDYPNPCRRKHLRQLADLVATARATSLFSSATARAQSAGRGERRHLLAYFSRTGHMRRQDDRAVLHERHERAGRHSADPAKALPTLSRRTGPVAGRRRARPRYAGDQHRRRCAATSRAAGRGRAMRPARADECITFATKDCIQSITFKNGVPMPIGRRGIDHLDR